MSTRNLISSGTASRMRTVLRACVDAPTGPHRNAALRCYADAGRAFGANKDTECVERLDAAVAALRPFQPD